MDRLKARVLPILLSAKAKNAFVNFDLEQWAYHDITYDLFDPAGTVDGFQQGAAFVNTDIATLSGFETYGHCQG